MKKIYLPVVLLFSLFSGYAQVGAPDPTFGNLGRVLTPSLTLNAQSEVGKVVLLQPDNKYLVLGTTNTATTASVFRLNADGSFDNNFDTDGIMYMYNFFPNAMALQGDGKILVAGYITTTTSSDFAVVRLNANGSPDAGFGTNGRVVTPIGPGAEQATSMVLQPDGKIVVAGFSSNGANNDFAVVRYNTNGSLDTGFDGDGKVTTPIGAGADQANAVALQGTKIVAAGFSFQANNDFAVVRYNADGSLDNTFDTDGKQTTAVLAGADVANSIAVQTDNKIILGGITASAGFNDMAMVRYNDNGALDVTFDTDGMVTYNLSPISRSDVISDMVLQPDGKILIAGYLTVIVGNDEFVFARFNTNGGLDLTFNTTGIVIFGGGGASEQLGRMRLLSDGSMVAAGLSTAYGSNDYTLVRYTSTGSPDISFGIDGILILPSFFAGANIINALAIQADGKVIGAGSSVNSSNGNDFGLIRYNTDGSIDNTFGVDGIVTQPMGGASNFAYALAIQADGKIVAAGSNSGNFAVGRFNTDGTLDDSFEGDGRVSTDFGSTDELRAVAIQPADGKIVVAGYTFVTGNSQDFAVARYNTDGTLDNSFDTDGKTTTAVTAGNVAEQALAIAIQADGKILVGGYTGTTRDFAMVRYNSNGTLDLSFDTDGKVITSMSASGDEIRSIAIQNNGQIVVAGIANPTGAGNDFAAARFNADGTLDAGFGTGGKVTTAVGPGVDVASGVALQNDGKIVLGGTSSSNGTSNDFAIVRYNENGTPDAGFDGDGIAFMDMSGNTTDAGNAIKLWDNRIYAAGSTFLETGLNFAVAAFINDGTPLPLHLLEFNGRLHNGGGLLAWNATNEINLLEYAVERSTDARSFTRIGTVAAFNTPGHHAYSYTDPKVAGLNVEVVYYRLQMKDLDGDFRYSKTIALNLKGNENFVMMSPNPVMDMAILSITISKDEQISYRIIDNSGKIVRTMQMMVREGSNAISVNVSGLNPGMYTIDIKGTKTNRQLRFVKL